MPRTITVKGVGRATTKPDYVIISMTLESKEKEYEEAMALAAKKIEYINSSFEKLGFEKSAVKTVDFNITTDYDSRRDPQGNYHQIFRGYVCRHYLKVEFDFDTKLLSCVLSAISKCLAKPVISISFTVKDPTSVKKELLKTATINAKEKAEILCEASNVQLGALLNIYYNWGEINIVSNTDFSIDEDCMSELCAPRGGAAIDFEPEDIKASDTATFIWEIK